jgi:hypothetical protein
MNYAKSPVIPSYDPDLHDEIAVGLVLKLDPAVLKTTGGKCRCKPAFLVVEPHYFYCREIIEAANESLWMPLYSRDGVNRKLLQGKKYGHPKWVNVTSFEHVDQVWVLTPKAVCLAAGSANDPTRKGNRNIVIF